MSEERLNLQSYYFGFIETGVIEVDRILSAIAQAGKRHHHTREWSEPNSAVDGITIETLIQAKANDAADSLRKQLSERDSEIRRLETILLNGAPWNEKEKRMAEENVALKSKLEAHCFDHMTEIEALKCQIASLREQLGEAEKILKTLWESDVYFTENDARQDAINATAKFLFPGTPSDGEGKS